MVISSGGCGAGDVPAADATEIAPGPHSQKTPAVHALFRAWDNARAGQAAGACLRTGHPVKRYCGTEAYRALTSLSLSARPKACTSSIAPSQ